MLWLQCSYWLVEPCIRWREKEVLSIAFLSAGSSAIATTTAMMVFGGEVSFPTLYGNVVCKVPAGTQSGRKIRLRGKGIVSMKDSKVHGDQYVTIQIQVPTQLTPEERQKLKEYEELTKKRGRGGRAA